MYSRIQHQILTSFLVKLKYKNKMFFAYWIKIKIVNNVFTLQIEDLSQQAQVAAAEKFKEPPIISAAEAGGSTTVNFWIMKYI
jgi:hypothetical protein